MRAASSCESHEEIAARLGRTASVYMGDGPQSAWEIAPWRAYDLAREAASHAFLARPDLRGEA